MDKLTQGNEIQRLMEYLSKQDPSSEEYTRAVQNLRTLVELNEKDKFNLELWAPLATQLLGIILILQHEHLHVITSRAFNWIRR